MISVSTETTIDGYELTGAPDASQPPKFTIARLRWVAGSGEERETYGMVEEAHSSRQVCLLSEPLEAGQTVWIKWLLEEHRTTVQHCQKRGKDYLVVLRHVMHERRTADRLTAGGAGKLSFSDDIYSRAVAVQVLNVSATGAQVASSERLDPHRNVRLTGSTWECPGKIRYCRKEGDSFFSGIQFVQPPRAKVRCAQPDSRHHSADPSR
jgi:hypothetical protein